MPTIQRLLRAQAEIQSGTSKTNQTFGDVKLPKILTTTHIDQIWFLDDYHHGQSIDLNKGLIGPVHSWLDGGRDIVNFIKHVMPPNHRRGTETLDWRERVSSNTKVIGLGHSVGGNAM
jgi:hypothetical protein